MSTTVIGGEYRVLGGPNAKRLIQAFELAYSGVKIEEKTVVFKLRSTSTNKVHKLRMRVTALKYESEAQGSFLIEGNNVGRTGGKVRGFYKTVDREGFFRIIP